MTLRLAVELTANGQGLSAGIQQARREVREFGAIVDETGRQAFDAASKADAAFKDHAATVRAAAAAMQQYQAVARSAAAIDQRLGVGAGGNSAARAADIAAYGQELDRLRARFSPLFAAQQAYRSELADVRQALRVGAISQREFDAALSRTKASFAAQVTQINGFRGGLLGAIGQVGRFRTQIQGLGYQVGDLAVQLASGQNALVALTQQGGQALQLFGGPWGAVFGAALSIVGALAIGLFSAASATGEAKSALEQYKDAHDLANEVLLTSNEQALLQKRLRIDEARETTKAAIATADLTTERLKAAHAAQRQIEQAMTARSTVARAANEASPGAGTGLIEEEMEENYRQLALLEEKLARLFDNDELGSVREEVERALKEATQTAARELERLNKEAERAAEDFGNAFQSLQDKLDPAGAALRAMTRDEHLLALAFERGMFGIDGSTEALTAYDAAMGRLYDHYKDKLDPIATAFDKLTAAQAQQVSQLDVEARAIGMNAVERARANATLEAENKLRAQGLDLTDPRAQAYIREAQAIAEREVVQRRSIASSRDAQEELTGFIEQSYDRIGSAITQGLAQGEISFVRLRDVGRAMISELIQWILKLAALNPIKNWLTGGNLPTLGSVFSSATGGMSGVAAAGGTSSVGGIGGGSSPFGGLSLGGLLGNGPGIGTILFGSPAVPGFAAGGGQAATSGLFGSGGGGATGSFLNSPLGGGLASGALALGASLLSGQDIVPALISAGLTGIGTAIAGPIGGLIGGMVGSLLGGLLGKKPKTKTFQSKAFVRPNEFGFFSVSDTQTKRLDSDFSQSLGDAATNEINDLLFQYGATLDAGTEGLLNFTRKTKGKKVKKEFYKAKINLYDPGATDAYAGYELGKYDTAEEALAALSAGLLFMSGVQGNIAGTGASTKAAFNNLFNQPGNKEENILTDRERIGEIIEFTKWLDGMDKARTASAAAAMALVEFEGALRKAQHEAKELGLSTDLAFAAMKRDFEENVRDELLQLTDPEAFALGELEKELAARKAVAEQLGIDMLDIERLYAIKRQQIVDQGLKGIASTWQEFINGLQFGQASGLSPTQQLENARLQFETAKGEGGNAFREASTTYLGILRSFYGGTEPYTRVFQEVIELAKQFGNLGDIPGFASGGDHAGGWMQINEHGPELVATGRARIFNASETANIFRASRLDRRISHVRHANENAVRHSDNSPSSEASLAMTQVLSALGGKLDQMAGEQSKLNKVIRRLIENRREQRHA